MTESTLIMSLNAVWVAVMATVGLFGAGLYTRPIGRCRAMTCDLPSAPLFMPS
jgi:hypothetical protein